MHRRYAIHHAGLLSLLQQYRHRHAEGLREALQHADRRVGTAALQSRDIRPGDPCLLRQRGLAELPSLPQPLEF